MVLKKMITELEADITAQAALLSEEKTFDENYAIIQEINSLKMKLANVSLAEQAIPAPKPAPKKPKLVEAVETVQKAFKPKPKPAKK